jgi:hypothetical protein
MTPCFTRGCGLLALAAWMSAAAAAPLVNATLEPARITMGQSAELTITSSGSSNAPLALPEVNGLDFRVVGQSHRVEIVGGATLVSTAIMVRVTPRAAGIYTIPGITPQSQPLVLRVDAEDAPDKPPGPGNVNSAATRAEGIRMTPDGSAYVRLVLPKREVFVGESIPVEIEVGMRNGFVSSLNGLPTLSGADFTLNNLSRQPERTPKLVDGREFTLLTWHSVLAPIKPGKFSLSVESPLTVRVQTRPARESRLEDALGDPFFQNYFGVTVSKEITVTSPATELTVLPLPAAGRPADFSGAVGSFQIADDLSSSTAAVGDPLTLRLHVTGTGNFDRVDSAMLDHLDAWKTYPPKSSFKASDPVGFRGEKIFEQPLIAAQSGPQTLPGLSFSYFDPATRRYEVARSAPLAVAITPSAADPSAGPPAAAGKTAGTAAAADGLRPDHALSGAAHRSLVPPYLQARYIAAPALFSLLIAGGWLGRRRSLMPRAPSRRTAKAAGRVLQRLEAAAQAANAAEFFSIARAAVLEVEGTEGASEDTREIFALADEAHYSGHPPTTTDYARWTEVVRRRILPEKGA